MQMIVSSSRAFFFRIPRPAQFTNSFVLGNLRKQFQKYQCYHGLSCISKQSTSKGIYFPMGWNRKRKTVNPVWRPISTESTFNEDCSMEDIMAEPENTASIEQGIHENCAISVVTATADSTICSSSLQAEDGSGEAEEVQVSRGPTGGSGPKDADGVLGDSMGISALHNTFGDAYTENISIAYKDRHAISVEVGASVMRFIIGKDRSVQKDIEEEMGVKLLFPSSKEEDSIVIESESMDAITKALEKIQAIIDEAVRSPALNYSHFVSLPLAIHSELVDKLNRFQSIILGGCDTKDACRTMDVDSNDESSEDEEISNNLEKATDVAVKLKVDDTNNVKVDITNIPLVSYAPKMKSPTLCDSGIDRSIFIKPKTFHLTVLMLKLWNKGRVHAAKEVLQSVHSELLEVLDNRPLFIRLKGLECLRGSQAKAQVLYAPVEEIGNEGRLRRACQIIIDAYVKAGLVLEKDAQQKLKLHATVMNTTNRKRWKSKRRRKDTFDARGIFEQFGHEQWGDYHIREAHLSQRFLYDEDGYYHCCASIPFPESSEVPETITQVESV